MEFKQVNPKALDFNYYIILREKEKKQEWEYRSKKDESEETFKKIRWKCW